MEEITETETETETSKWRRTRKTVKTSSTTKTTTMTTPAKLYGKDLSEYDEVDVDALLAQLSPEEINILAKEVDPDDNFLPPNQRCSYECTKDPTGPLNRKKLIEHINKEALETPDVPELEPYVKGTVRGKKWVPPPRDEREIAVDEQIAIDLGDEYEHALSDATQEEIIDLAAILGFHSMMNQDQYHASLLNKGQPVGMGWDGITKSTTQKLYPMDPPNNTDVEESIKRVKDDDPKLIELNLNNIKNISDEKFEQLFDALPQNEHLEVLSLTNVGLTDKTALLLAEAIEKSKTLRVLNVETNFINPPVIVTLVKALLKARTIEEFRASNQRSTVLGNKIEMEITDLVEKNTSLLRLGLHLEFNDARHRVAAHLQRNIDRNEHELRKGTSSSPIPNATSIKTSAAGTVDDLSSLLSLQKSIKAKSPKPMHIVLTPQERIDSKSELIASLVSQKLSDRGRGEISLAVPQIGQGSRSPSKERKSPVKVKERSPPPKDGKSPNKAKELSPKPVQEGETVVKKEDDKQASPTRHPKIGELRGSTLSKAIDEEILPLQENGVTPDLIKIVQKSKETATLEIGIKKTSEKITQPYNEDKSLPPDTVQTEHDAPNPKVSVDLIQSRTEAQLAVSKPKIYEDLSQPSIDSSSTLPKSNESEVSTDLVQTRIEVSADKIVPEILSKVEETENIKNLKLIEQARQPEIVKKTISVSDRNSGDLLDNRKRLSESVSPSRHLEDKLTLLQAKIDSFAEVADEKLSSIRLKFDDLARDTTANQSIDSSTLPSAIAKPDESPLPKESKVKIGEAAHNVKPIDKVTQPIDSSILLPKAQPKGVSFPARPPAKTPNSVGITFLYQKQIFSKAEIQTSSIATQPVVPNPSVDERKSIDLPKESVLGVKRSETIIEKIIQPLQISASEDAQMTDRNNIKITEVGLKPEEFNPKPNSPTPDTIKPKLEEITPMANNPTTDSIKPNSKEGTPTVNNPTIDSPIDQPKSDKAVAISPIFNPPLPTTNPLIALSKLSVKKGDPLQIDPIKKVEAETQSPAQLSPLSRLSFKKGEPQKIDPIKKTEVGTQSPAKPNPLSLLSIKKCNLVDINPVRRSEVSTQSSLEEPKSEASSQTIDDEPTKTNEESTQTPLVFSSLEHDYVFPGLRRVPYLPRPKTINIGGGDRVIIKPSSKSINEVLMLLYPAVRDYSTMKPQNFGLEQDIVKDIAPESTIKDLEEAIQKATEVSDEILKVTLKPTEDPIKSDENIEETTSIKTEIQIPLVEEPNSLDDRERVSTATLYETKFTAVEKVSGLSRTTIASEEHVEVIDKAYKSVAEVSSAGEEHISKTSIRSANMWESLSSNLIKASEQTLIDISKSANLGENVSSTRTKIGKVSVYSSIEDLSHSSRSKYSDRRIGGLIKTVEKTSVYSSSEDLPISSYTKYSDRYGDDHAKTVSTTSVYSSTEDLTQSSRTKYSDRYASDLVKSAGKASVYSSTEDLLEIPYTKYSDRYSDVKEVGKASHYTVDTSNYKSKEDILLLPRSKFSDLYKDDQVKPMVTHRSHPKFPVSTKFERSHYKSADHLTSRSQYKSTDDYSHRTKIGDRSAHEVIKSQETSLQSAILSSISRNQSAISRPYTYVPTSIYTDLTIDHVRSRPSSPAAIHTSTLQLNISPSGISEFPPTRRYISENTIDNPKIVISRPKDGNRSIRAISPLERYRPSANLLSPYHKVSDQTNDDLIDESSQSTLDISSAYAASTAECNASTTTTTATSIPTTTPKKRVNIMDTIKMLKNRVRDVITTEDRLSETHRLPSSSSIVSSSQSSSTRTTSSSLTIPHDNDEKEV